MSIGVVEGYKFHVLPITVQLTTLHEQANYRDEATFPQSTFQVAFFVSHPTDVSEMPDKNSD